MQPRQSHYDVTNTVKISDPRAVAREVCRLLRGVHPKADLAPVRKAFDTFTRIYSGTLPGYHGCDTWYHDAQHSLDCTLAIARLIDGHERTSSRSDRLGHRRARLGVICALFHDVGYIRRLDETQFRNGAELTLFHVTRSGEFLGEFLPTVGFAREAQMVRKLVHFTGYEMALDAIKVTDAKDRRLGFLLGTADLMAQMADRNYPEKCRDFLYHEFVACGLAGQGTGKARPIYSSPDDLLRKTPEFARKLFNERLDGYFEGAYRYIEDHFGGVNPYLSEIRRHIDFIRQAVEQGSMEQMRRHPESINAHALRQITGIHVADRRRRRATLPLHSRRTRRNRVAGADFVPA